MESDDDRFASVAQHDRAAAEGARNDSVFEEYADERALLDAHVIGSTASLSSSGASSFSSRSMPITEPYERYKSIELRAECYRRGTRPIRTGPKANDNKAGYLTLLRSYDVIQNGSEPSKDGLPSAQAQQQEQQEQQDSLQDFALQSAKKRKVSSPQESDAQEQSDKSSTAAAAAPQSGKANSAKRRSRVRKNGISTFAAAQGNLSRLGNSQSNGLNGSTAGMPFIPCDPKLATEYMRLKMQILLESRELDKTHRRDEQRSKLHAELQGVITTLAQLHRLAKEYTLERDGVLLADVNQDIIYFQEQKRKIKLEVEMLDRYR